MTMRELPDLTTYTRENLLDLVSIYHMSARDTAERFDEALALIRQRAEGPAALTSEQGKAWRERAEVAERENERLHALVEELREALVVIRDETALVRELEMPITSIRNAASLAHGRADYALSKNGIGLLPLDTSSGGEP